MPTAGLDLVTARERNAALIEWLARRRGKATSIAALCSGVSLLAAAGLLDGRPATTHWGLVDQCRRRYPAVRWTPDRIVTESGNIFCGGGLYASIDLSLHLVERYCGHGVAVQTAKALSLEAPRIWQTAYAAQPPRAGHDDEPIGRAQKWLHAHYRDEVDLEALAAKVAMRPRSARREGSDEPSQLRAPVQFGDGRTASGLPSPASHRSSEHRLESGHRSVQAISEEVGYEDVAFFRTLFRRYTGTSPREYRARFGPRRAA